MATATEPPLLTYALEPKLLPVSTPIKPSPGKLEIAATAAGDVYCDSITIRIPIGPGEEDLTTDKTITARLESDNPGVPDAWPVEQRLEAGDTILAVRFQPNLTVRILAGTRLTLHIADFDVNEEIGTAQITITELTSPTSTGPYPERTTSREVNKGPAGFYLRNLAPDHIAVENGEAVVLTWETSGGTTYRMYWDHLSEALSIGDTAWRSPALTRTTGFMLQASAETRSGRSLILQTLTTAVTVTNQDLAARDLAVNGTLDIGNGPGTATTNLGFSTDEHGVKHLPSSMTDGNRNTYYWSALHPKVDDWVMVDLGSERQITKIEIYFGATTGFTLPSCDLQHSTDRTQWHKHTTIPAGRPEYTSGTIAQTARYVRLKMNAAQTYRIAIRSFEITTVLRGATITPTSTVIHGNLVVKGTILAENDVTVDKDHVLNVNWINSAGGDTKPITIRDDVTVTATKTLRTNLIRAANNTNPIKIQDQLTVEGTLTANNALTVQGTLTANNALTVKGTLTTSGALTANGAIQANGNLTVASGKTLAVQGELSATGPTKLFGNFYRKYWSQQSTKPKQATPWTAKAPTDGILFGAIEIFDRTGSNDNIGAKGRLVIRVGSSDFWATAPILRQTGAGAGIYTLTVAVGKGDDISCYLWLDNFSVVWEKFAIELTWCPLGENRTIF
ncbi:discoidin domain-containing protein [Streptomyces coffeae]|uniref:Discoidin domain-containing protein n=1 Tax=Streptomyces coffeae TaxID=621382 RepID=A0ABS1NRK4_9ACTN|nr:discoidin domain-containing protein [Streptomyces coffeae]MBL1102584.1 discoidin domain-containing protein [Streptomyces coffeae]